MTGMTLKLSALALAAALTGCGGGGGGNNDNKDDLQKKQTEKITRMLMEENERKRDLAQKRVGPRGLADIQNSGHINAAIQMIATTERLRVVAQDKNPTFNWTTFFDAYDNTAKTNLASEHEILVNHIRGLNPDFAATKPGFAIAVLDALKVPFKKVQTVGEVVTALPNQVRDFDILSASALQNLPLTYLDLTPAGTVQSFIVYTPSATRNEHNGSFTTYVSNEYGTHWHAVENGYVRELKLTDIHDIEMRSVTDFSGDWLPNRSKNIRVVSYR